MELRTVNTLTGPLVLARTRAPDLESVRKLNCWGSDIEDISIVRQMPNLEVCSVSVNDITTLSDFENCLNLQELYIRNNKIKHLHDICYLKDLKKLRILWLADNPCATGDNYRMTVLRVLPNLQKLDNIVVQDDEVETAKTAGDELSLPDSEKEAESSDINSKEEGPGDTSNETEPNISNGAESTGVISNGNASPADKEKSTLPKDPITLSWEETNKIREQLGLKPLPKEKLTTPKSAPTSSTRARNAHVLQAVLILIKELDRDSLEIVDTSIKKRLENL